MMNLKLLDYFELPTVALIIACYGFWACLVLFGDSIPIIAWIVATAIITTLHFSLLHEVVHGHPTSNRFLNRAMVAFPISWVFPFERFRDTHLQHHETGELTDPLDDPESWYVYAHEWQRFGDLLKLILTFNNTLAGRMLIGPIITLMRFVGSELRLIFTAPDLRWRIINSWAVHIALCIALILLVSQFATQPLWAFAISTYLGMSILLIRTFLEHQAAEDFSERTVIIEQNCPIACLFLFNNLHALHHRKPGIPWYRLPGTYAQNREQLLKENRYYFYRSYAEIFRRYFLTAKEPVLHPENKHSSNHQSSHYQAAQG